MQPLDRRRLQAVAIGQPLRDEVHDLGAHQFQRPAQDDRRGDAVDVVVAVDRDPLVPRDGGENPIDRRPHVGEPHRIVQMLQPRVEESRSEIGIAEAALTEETCDERRQLQRLRQRAGRGVVAG